MASASSRRATSGCATPSASLTRSSSTRPASSTAASRTSRCRASPQIHGPSFALLSPTTDITVQDTLTWVRGAHSVRSGFAVSRNRKDQNGRGNYFGSISLQPGGQPEQHRQRPRRRAARQLPHLQRGLGGSGRLLPLHHLPGVRLRHVARAREPVDRGRGPLRVLHADLHAGQQPGELRSEPLRPEPGGAGTAERPARARRRQSVQRPGDRRRRDPRGSARARGAAHRPATTPASPSGRRAASTTRRTCSCRASASPTR